jgi:hypothetical protein
MFFKKIPYSAGSKKSTSVVTLILALPYHTFSLKYLYSYYLVSEQNQLMTTDKFDVFQQHFNSYIWLNK